MTWNNEKNDEEREGKDGGFLEHERKTTKEYIEYMTSKHIL